MLMEGAGRRVVAGGMCFSGPLPRSLLLSFSCVWVSLSLSVPYGHLPGLPPEPLETPEPELTPEQSPRSWSLRRALQLNPGLHFEG